MSVTFLLAKLFRALLTTWFAVTFVFAMLRVSGDPALEILGAEATPQMVAHFNRMFGLDQPLLQQYMTYLQAVLSGDFGQSFRDGRDAVAVVAEAIPNTLLLMGTAFIVAIMIGIPAGVVAALKRSSWVDRAVMGFAIIGFSLPNFFLGILLILLFTLHWRLLPAGGSATWVHLMMPVITIGTYYAGLLARFARSSMLEVLSRPYIPAARARGFSATATICRHALPNAAIPLVTMCGLIIGGLISGAAITETVFAWPGVGRLLVGAVTSRDMPIIQFIVLIVIVSMVVTNLIVDLTYGLLDPRIRLHRTSESPA